MTVYLARGTTPAERQQSIATIKNYLEAAQMSRNPDKLQEMLDATEEDASTVAKRTTAEGKDEYLYIHPGNTRAADRQGPTKPADKAFDIAAKGTHNMYVDSLASIDVGEVIERVTNDHVRLHDATHAIALNPTARQADDVETGLRRALEVLTGTANHADALLAGIEWGGGRPPLGCTSKDGRLAPADNYDEVCRMLQHVRNGYPKTDAANELGCARKTIDNALDRPELYRLE